MTLEVKDYVETGEEEEEALVTLGDKACQKHVLRVRRCTANAQSSSGSSTMSGRNGEQAMPRFSGPMWHRSHNVLQASIVVEAQSHRKMSLPDAAREAEA